MNRFNNSLLLLLGVMKSVSWCNLSLHPFFTYFDASSFNVQQDFRFDLGTYRIELSIEEQRGMNMFVEPFYYSAGLLQIYFTATDITTDCHRG